jgi:hypothetical protein
MNKLLRYWKFTALYVVPTVTLLVLLLRPMYSRIVKPLGASVTMTTYRVSPQIIEDVNDIRDSLSDSLVVARVESLMPAHIMRFDLRWALSAPRRELDILLLRAGSHSVMWTAEIRNDGDRQLEAVTLVLPGVDYAVIQREGLAEETRQVSTRIVIGSLSAKEKMSVLAWASHAPLTEEVRLVHRDGVGRAKLLRPVGRAGQFADSFVRSLSYLAVPIAVGVLAVAVVQWVFSRFTVGSPDGGK